MLEEQQKQITGLKVQIRNIVKLLKDNNVQPESVAQDEEKFLDEDADYNAVPERRSASVFDMEVRHGNDQENDTIKSRQAGAQANIIPGSLPVTMSVDVPPAEPLFVTSSSKSVSERIAESAADVSLANEPKERIQEKRASATDVIAQGLQLAKDWLMGGNPILRLGALILFLGLAFLLRYTSHHIYLPVEMRYALVAAAGLGLTIGGWLLRHKKPNFGLMLQGTGIAVFYLTTFAALKLGMLIDPTTAFVVLVAITVASVVLALLQDSVGLAIAAFLGAFAAPVLASSGGGSHISLFFYLALLNIALVVIAWFRAWRPLNLIGFMATFGIGSAWGIGAYGPEFFATTEPFLIFFFLLYVGIALLFARHRLMEAGTPPDDINADQRLLWAARKTHYVDGTLFFGLPLIGFGLQYALVSHIQYGAALSAFILGSFYIGLGFIMLRRGFAQLQLMFETCIGLGVIFATLAVPLALDSSWTSAIWAVEGAGVYWLSVRQPRLLGRIFSTLLQAYAFLCWFEKVHAGDTTVLAGPWFGAVLLTLAYFFSWRQVVSAPAGVLRSFENPVRSFFAAGSAIALCLVPAFLFDAQFTVVVVGILSLGVLYAGIRYREAVLIVLAPLGYALTVLYLGSDILYYAASSNVLPLWLVRFVLFAIGFGSAFLLHINRNNESLKHSLGQFYHYWAHACLFYALALWGWFVFDTLPYSKMGFYYTHGVLIFTSLAALLGVVIAQRFSWRMLANIIVAMVPVAALVLLACFGVIWVMLGGSFIYTAFNGWLFMSLFYQPLTHGGWLCWPLFIGAHLFALRKLSSISSVGLMRVAQVICVWLLVGLVAVTMHAAMTHLSDIYNAWFWLSVIVAPSAYLFAVCFGKRLWPISQNPFIYRFVAAAPIACLMVLWVWLVNIVDSGNAAPFPYLPLVNPLEIGLLIALFVLWQWQKLFSNRLADKLGSRAVPVFFAITLFAIATATVLRAVHHYAGVPWRFSAMMGSMSAQAALSITWTVIAVAVMLAGHKWGRRVLWLCGGGLIAVVLGKMLLVDLGNNGTLERIVSFIGVGILLLIVGYFAPLPPRMIKQDLKKTGADNK